MPLTGVTSHKKAGRYSACQWSINWLNRRYIYIYWAD